MIDTKEIDQTQKSINCPECQSLNLRSRNRLGVTDQPPFKALIRKYQCLNCGLYFHTSESYLNAYIDIPHLTHSQNYIKARAVGIQLRKQRATIQTKLHTEYNPKSSSGEPKGSNNYETIQLLEAHYPYTKVRELVREQLMTDLTPITPEAQAFRDYMWQEKEPTPIQTLNALEPLLTIIETLERRT